MTCFGLREILFCSLRKTYKAEDRDRHIVFWMRQEEVEKGVLLLCMYTRHHELYLHYPRMPPLPCIHLCTYKRITHRRFAGQWLQLPIYRFNHVLQKSRLYLCATPTGLRRHRPRRQAF